MKSEPIPASVFLGRVMAWLRERGLMVGCRLLNGGAWRSYGRPQCPSALIHVIPGLPLTRMLGGDRGMTGAMLGDLRDLARCSGYLPYRDRSGYLHFFRYDTPAGRMKAEDGPAVAYDESDIPF